jgi:transcriptional regulator of nitric oxide reductase
MAGGALPPVGALLVSRTNSGVVLALVSFDLSSSSPLQLMIKTAKSDAQTKASKLRKVKIITAPQQHRKQRYLLSKR